MTASIGESLTLLAQVAGVPIRGLDDEQLDIVALRLVIECDDQPVLACIGQIVDEVRQAEGVAERRLEGERQARMKLIESHTAEDARTGIHPVPRRPDFVRIPEANEWTDNRQGALAMTADVLSDDRLYRRIDAGDAQSLRRLFSRHAPLAVALIAHVVGRSQAQDIVQETFLLLWNRRLHQPDEGSVQNWLLATAHQRAVEMVRSGEALSRGPTGGALRTIVDAGAMPARRVDPHTRGRQAVVLHALMSLPVDERAPIELMYFRGLSRRQIAERLNVSLPELRERSTDGLRRLDHALRSSGKYGPTAEIVSIASAEDPSVPKAGRQRAPMREPERVEVMEPRVELRGA